MREYLLKYRNHIFFIGIFIFFIHGAKLNSDIIGIDTEDLMNLQGAFYDGWLQSGRFGLVGLKYLLGNAGFNPYYTGVMTLVLFGVALFAFFLLCDYVQGTSADKRQMLPWALGSLLWISHPILVEQFYFSLQSMEICIGIFFTVAALYSAMRMVQKRKIWYGAASVLMLVVTFSTYQVFVVMFVFAVVVILLLQALNEASNETSNETAEEITARKLLARILPFAIIFLIAFVVYNIVNKLFFASSDYLQNQVAWGTHSALDCLRSIAGHVVKAFTGYDSVFYSAGLGILAIWTFVLLIAYLKKRCNVKKSVALVIVFFYMALLVTPFMMTVILGSSPAYRSQLVLPALTGFLGYLAISLHRRIGVKKGRSQLIFTCGAILCVITALEQTKVSESLYYTDSCRYEQDASLARELIREVEKINFNGQSLPVIVIGTREFEGNDSCVIGEVIGRSFFAYDTDVEPLSYWSSRRAVGFMNVIGGKEYALIPMDKVDEAREYSRYMPEYPFEGCVQVKDNMIIIKLSHYE